MTALTLYGLKSCDTCRAALRDLGAAGHDVTFVDIRADADLDKHLPEWLGQPAGELLINKRSTTWRNLSEEQRNQPATQLLSEHPTLIKRPVIVSGGQVSVGWGADIKKQFI